MRDKDFVRIYYKGINNQRLDELEAIQFSSFITRFFGLCESNVTASKAQLNFEGDYEVEFLYGNPYLHKLINTKEGGRWFEEDAPAIFSKEFLDNVSRFRPDR